ncbi:hypothetical protein ACFPRL_20240 [Pseudoclavibacter helvolus]
MGPFVTSSQKRSASWPGAGRNCGEMRPAAVTSHHTASTTTATDIGARMRADVVFIYPAFVKAPGMTRRVGSPNGSAGSTS